MSDGGPIYFETNPEHYIAEPWNGASALIFIFIALYWGFKIRGKFRSHPFLAIAVPILLIGGGLTALKTATVLTGLPFAVILIVMCFSFYKSLTSYYDRNYLKKRKAGRSSSGLKMN
jgi:hypothetical protein